MKSVFTILWCVKLQYDPTCVYYTSFILDALLCLYLAPYGFGFANYNYWPSYIYLAASIASFLMAIFAIVQIITKNSSAPSRHGNYVKCRLYFIIGLAIAAAILFVLYMTYTDRYYKPNIRWALQIAAPFLFNAAFLHSYHENFV